MLGYAEAELVGRHYSAIVAPRELPAVTAQARQRQAGATTRYETRLLTRGGQEVPVIIAGTPLYKDGRFTGTLATIVDISERKAGEETIQHANQELTRWLMEAEQRTRETTLLNELGDLLQGCRTAADAYVVVGEILGPLFPGDSGRFYIQAQVRLETAAQWGPPLAAPFDFSAGDCQAMRHGRLHAGLLPGSGLSPACTHLAQPKPLAYVCAPLIAQAETLGLLHLSTASPNAGWLEARQRLARTVADSLALALANLELRERLRQQSIRDPLTGLFNRRYLEETFERELHRAEREARPVGIIMLDLDHFKQFNDDLGHEAGDHLLRELGCLLRTQVRGADIPCRYGGEEFTIILPGASLEVARDRAQVICQAVNQMQVTFAGQPLQRVTLSAGVAVFPDHGATADQVLRAADAALYRAKHLGRHRVHAAE
jgi:diguanylate cyclase (GGDEF)-like protein